jgi:outer membrane protein assembly factor BamB
MSSPVLTAGLQLEPSAVPSDARSRLSRAALFGAFVMILVMIRIGFRAGGLGAPLGAASNASASSVGPVDGDGAPLSPADPLPESALWPNLFGPTHDMRSTETDLKLSWGPEGPKRIWRLVVGEGYASPSIRGNDLVLFHRLGNREVVDLLDADTAKHRWRHEYSTAYVDRYGYSGGPRCTPIITADRIISYGAEGSLRCLNRADGKLIWSRELSADHKVEQGFFGVGATPLLVGDQLVINVGGTVPESGVVSVNLADGKTRWQVSADGASYATPRFAEIHGQSHVFVFTQAGLVSVDPRVGKARWSVPFRSRIFESVNATSPVVVGDLVIVSATYNTGSLCLKIAPDGSSTEVWRTRRDLESHFSNILERDGFLYAFSGRHEPDCEIRCVEASTGKVRWRMASEYGRGSWLQLGERAIVWGERGQLGLWKLDPNQPTELIAPGRRHLEGITWPPPVLVAGRLYLRSESELACHDLRPAR